MLTDLNFFKALIESFMRKEVCTIQNFMKLKPSFIDFIYIITS